MTRNSKIITEYNQVLILPTLLINQKYFREKYLNLLFHPPPHQKMNIVDTHHNNLANTAMIVLYYPTNTIMIILNKPTNTVTIVYNNLINTVMIVRNKLINTVMKILYQINKVTMGHNKIQNTVMIIVKQNYTLIHRLKI